jgi:hypothetical protein
MFRLKLHKTKFVFVLIRVLVYIWCRMMESVLVIIYSQLAVDQSMHIVFLMLDIGK